MSTLDQGMTRQLQKQELDYLQAYNVFVKRKEREIKDVIDTINQSNANE